jgi:methyl-accepting chemotaxis protein
MNLRQKMILGALAITIIPVMIITVSLDTLSFNAGRVSLEQQAKNRLISVRDSRKSQIESYLSTITRQVQTFSNDRMIIDATQEFKLAFPRYSQQTESGELSSSDRLQRTQLIENYYRRKFIDEYEKRNTDTPPDVSRYLTLLDQNSLALQHTYIANNPYPLGSKDKLLKNQDESTYSTLHGRYHPHIKDFLNAFGYYDIFLVDAVTGNIVYSVFKELDYATSLIDGPYANTGIGRVFKKANELSDPNGVAFDDFAPYLPSYNDQATFIASPIFDQNKKVGILIFQAPIDRINAIMTTGNEWRRYGLGDSGETYIVGADKLMRNDSRFLFDDKSAYIEKLHNTEIDKDIINTIDVKNTSVGLQPILTPGVESALQGKTGFATFADYRGVSVLSAYTPLDVHGLRWAVIAEIDEAEAFAPTVALRKNIRVWSIAIGLLVLAVGVGVVFVFVGNIMRPVVELERTVTAVAAGDYHARAKVISQDELGTLATTLNNLLDDRIAQLAEMEKQNVQLNSSIIELLQGAQQLSQRDLTVALPVAEDITGPLSDAISQVAEEFSEVLMDVRKFADEVTDTSQQVKNQSDSVSKSAAHDLQELTNTVALLDDATITMNDNADIAKNCNEMTQTMLTASQRAEQVVKATIDSMDHIRTAIHETEKRIKQLGDRSQEINNVVTIIDEIAERTHVLALNASMQAAAAGEQGRVFSVVADEVQRLAESARDATSQISALVKTIHIETSDTAKNMGNTIIQVVEGTKYAQTAGSEMESTTQMANSLAQSVSQIAKSCLDQSQVNQQLKLRADNIKNSTEQTREQLQNQNSLTSMLLGNAKKLTGSVQLFKLPE